MIRRPNAQAAFAGLVTEETDRVTSRTVLITESGVLGGDLLPRAYLDATFKALKSEFDKISAETEDTIESRVVGSGHFGAENRHTFSDMDLILRMEKPETLDRLKQWAHEETSNVRDIDSRNSGKDLNPKSMGDKFSFLFPIHKPGGEELTIGELRAILQARHGSTNWREHHDERLKIQANMDNIAKKNGPAMVQVDIMHVLVDGADSAELVRRAQRLVKHLDNLGLDNHQQVIDWINQTIGGEDAQDFEHHYEFLRTHGGMQTNDAQQMLAAIYYLKHGDKGKERLNNRWTNIQSRYSHHADGLQILYFIAKQVGMPLDHDNFNKQTIQTIIQAAEQAGIVSDKLTPEMLRQPAEAFETLRGKFKEEARKQLVANTKNKRADEHNPSALWKNLGSREIRKI